jgi:hypothetical protein
MSETKRIRYLIEPEYKKSTYEEQTWTNTLKNSKPVSLKVGNLYRWGSFNIELSEKEKEDIVKKETVLLNDYENFELIEMWDGGCDFWVDIVDEGSFTEEELEEINSLIYSWPVGKCPEDEDEDEDGYDEQKMEFNGWTENDCEYYVNTPIKLEVVVE